MKMSPEMMIAIFNLISNVGLPLAVSIMDDIKNAKTVDDAISALHTSSLKTWADYKAEVQPSTPIV